MLFGIETSEITGHKTRLLFFKHVCDESRAATVSSYGVVVAISKRSNRAFGFGEQARSRERPNHFQIVRSRSAPILNYVVFDIGPERYGPVNARCHESRFPGRIPKRRNFDIFRIPVPA